jgi:hypothetical protein
MWLWRRRFLFAYLALTAAFLAKVATFRDSRTGWTPLVVFGDRFAATRLPELRDVPIYTYGNSDGYDGQFYAQLAVAGNPFVPEVRLALDSAAYRSGRILLPAVAHVVGLGRPSWILKVYALSNVAAWLILAWAMARWWFPPESFDNLVRWTGTLFGAGMIVSVARSLTDGPSVLVIALGMRAIELNRQRLAAVLLGAAGLVRETSVVAAAAFVPTKFSAMRAWHNLVLVVSVCVLPIVVWTAILIAHYHAYSAGVFGVPGLWLPKELSTIARLVRAKDWTFAGDETFVVLTVLVQAGFLFARAEPARPWWRVGVGFAILAVCRGASYWDDALVGVPRTILPLTLAFNVLVPRTRGGLALLVAGNLTVLSYSRSFLVMPSEQTLFPRGITCDFISGWHPSEHLGRRVWRWAAHSAALTIHNPMPENVEVAIDVKMRSDTDRNVTFHTRDLEQLVHIQGHHGGPVHVGPFELPPGDTTLGLDTEESPWVEPGRHGRALTFAVEDLWIKPTTSAERTP